MEIKPTRGPNPISQQVTENTSATKSQSKLGISSQKDSFEDASAPDANVIASTTNVVVSTFTFGASQAIGLAVNAAKSIGNGVIAATPQGNETSTSVRPTDTNKPQEKGQSEKDRD
jgi:hypothetical protein